MFKALVSCFGVFPSIGFYPFKGFFNRKLQFQFVFAALLVAAFAVAVPNPEAAPEPKPQFYSAAPYAYSAYYGAPYAYYF